LVTTCGDLKSATGNTAGAISDAVVLPQLAVGARVVICGTASVASWDPPPSGPRVERHLLVKRARMSGLLVFDYQHRYEEAIARLAGWIREGWPAPGSVDTRLS
jgi:NADPH-dependent curcumin reductase CurA